MPPRPLLPLLAAVTAGATFALGLAGCAPAPESGTVTVLNSATDTAEHTKNQRFFDRCARRLGLRVEQHSVPADQVSSQALRMASAKSLPDILELDGSELPQFAETSGLRPLDQLGVHTAGFSRSAVALGSFRGTRYGIARSVNSLALYYDPDLLREEHVEPPRTWEELRATARRLTGKGTYGLAFSASPDADGVYQFLPFFWSNGGDEARLDGRKGADALRLWRRMVDDGSVSRSVVNWNQQDVNDQFVAGRAAMMINGPWQVPVLDGQEKVDWAVAPIPVPRAGDEAVSPIGGTVMTVPKSDDADREENAAKILNCLNTARNQLEWGEAVNNVPTRTAVARDYAERRPKLAAFAELVSTARSRTGRVGTRWPVVSDALAGAFQSVLADGAGPEAALSRAQRRATAGE
ncbi:sugar ABC transporter substrate-binding protein [Streptomyces xiaopingdaonensis]|uniref:sugar ABC transporter substrate-binding protein n=1 Tax=Streptomyces xiaopingdaonensis TaxID=1565415 RepID=UPI0002F668A9|nr:extracellular solute-binding protein [Streptomyces xiaopingdaonensis]